MGGFYSGNLDTWSLLLMNYCVYLAIWIISIYVAEPPTDTRKAGRIAVAIS
jgi:hypothetical protein